MGNIIQFYSKVIFHIILIIQQLNSKITMTTHRETKKFNSYKEERLKSARKNLSESVTFTKDLEELESAMKLSVNRRSSGNLNTMRLSLKRQLSESFSISSPPLTESNLRLSHVNDRFISKYMDRDSNIMEVSEEEPVMNNVLAEKSMSTNNLLVKPKRKGIETVRRGDLKVTGTITATGSTKNLGKLTQSRIQKVVKKKGTTSSNSANKLEIVKMMKKIELLGEQIDKLDLACGKEVLHHLQTVMSRLREQC